MTVTISSTELQRNIGALTDQATREPIIITTYGRERLALIPIEDWRRLKRLDGRQILDSEELSEDILQALMNEQKRMTMMGKVANMVNTRWRSLNEGGYDTRGRLRHQLSTPVEGIARQRADCRTEKLIQRYCPFANRNR